MCCLRERNSCRSVLMVFVSGTKKGSRMIEETGDAWWSGSMRQLKRSFAWTIPTILSRVSLYTGMRECPEATTLAATSLRDRSCDTQSMSVRGVMVSNTFRSLKRRMPRSIDSSSGSTSPSSRASMIACSRLSSSSRPKKRPSLAQILLCPSLPSSKTLSLMLKEKGAPPAVCGAL